MAVDWGILTGWPESAFSISGSTSPPVVVQLEKSENGPEGKVEGLDLGLGLGLGK
jgi:hypothetical protein